MLELQQKYAAMWKEAELALETGEYTPDTPPRHGEPRWGLSLVALVDGDVRARIEDDLMPISEALGTHHFVYSPENLHMTVRSLEGYQDEISEEQVEFYAEQATRALGASPAVEVVCRGLGGSRGGLFVRGYPSESLIHVRTVLHDCAERLGPRSFVSNDYRAMRDTAHISLAVFQEPAVPEPRIARVITERADKDYGVLRPASLALVGYTIAGGAITVNQIRTVRAA